MLNYVAIQMTSFLVSGPMKDPNPLIANAQTPKILVSARLPPLLPDPIYRVHWGFIVALVAAAAIWWLLRNSTLGFEIRTIGANPQAARYAGIAVGRTMVMAMALAGGLAGLGASLEVVGLNFYHTAGFSVGYGFDSIAVALLGRGDPIGVIPSALLFGPRDIAGQRRGEEYRPGDNRRREYSRPLAHRSRLLVDRRPRQRPGPREALKKAPRQVGGPFAQALLIYVKFLPRPDREEEDCMAAWLPPWLVV